MAPWLAGRRVTSVMQLPGGFLNRNLRVGIDGAPAVVVLRLYDFDAAACAREAAVLRLVHDTVPVPDVLYVEAAASDDAPPHVVLGFVEGISLFSLRSGPDPDAVAEAARDAGRALARLGTFRFPRPGVLTGGLGVDVSFLGGNVTNAGLVEHFTDAPLFRRRIEARLVERLRNVARAYEARVAAASGEPTLTHGDYNARNVLVRETSAGWRVAAVLDWEFALAASPFVDIGNFLRYDGTTRKHALEPHFSQGLREGGLDLPDDWRVLARMMDLPACCELLGRDGMPDEAIDELRAILARTVEELPAP